MDKKYKIGDSYKIIEDGKVVTGTIYDIQDGKYKVKWSDGANSTEVVIRPMMKG